MSGVTTAQDWLAAVLWTILGLLGLWAARRELRTLAERMKLPEEELDATLARLLGPDEREPDGNQERRDEPEDSRA